MERRRNQSNAFPMSTKIHFDDKSVHIQADRPVVAASKSAAICVTKEFMRLSKTKW